MLSVSWKEAISKFTQDLYSVHTFNLENLPLIPILMEKCILFELFSLFSFIDVERERSAV